MPSGISRRIERESGLEGLFDALARKIPGVDLRSLLLEIFLARATAVKESSIRELAAHDALFAPSPVPARQFLAFDSSAFEAASEFVALDLSPVCPFAAASVLGGASQNNVLTTIRNAEVLGDPTIAMAIEAARRRRAESVVQLCASHRVIRLQPFDQPGFSPHFRLFALASAGRDSGAFRFEAEQLIMHVRVYLRLFRALSAEGFALQSPLVEFADMTTIEAALAAAGITRDEIRRSVRAHKPGGTERFLHERGIAGAFDAPHPLLDSTVIEPLRREFPDAQFRVNQRRLEGFGYYNSFTLRISAQAPDGARHAIVDGGFTNWTARLLASRKERLLISGIGSEFVCKIYARGFGCNFE